MGDSKRRTTKSTNQKDVLVDTRASGWQKFCAFSQNNASWITLVVVVVGGIANYLAINKPQADRLAAENDMKKDVLFESVAPRVHMDIPEDAKFHKDGFFIRARMVNDGIRPAKIAYSYRLQNFPAKGKASDTLPAASQLTPQSCTVTYILSGETIGCLTGHNSKDLFDNVESVNYRVTIVATTDLSKQSETYKQLRSAYSESEIDKKTIIERTYSGTFSRSQSRL